MNRLFSWERASLGLLFLNFGLGIWLIWRIHDGIEVTLLTWVALSILLQAMIWTVSKSRPREVIPANLDALVSRFRRSDEGRRSAIFDEPTQLYHRWYLELRLEEEAERCTRYGISMAVVAFKPGLIDLESFSEDTWRQRAADSARRAAGLVRKVDLAAAISPMEYVICLVHCDRPGAERAIERLAEELSEYDCKAGIAVFPEDQREPAKLIETAMVRCRSVVRAA